MSSAHFDQKMDPEEKAHASHPLAARIAWVAAWAWAIVAGGGGFMLLVTRGPLPLTNGWFAMFSGMAGCPLTATLSEKWLGIRLSGRTRIAAAVLFFIAGRIALLIGSRVPWLSR